MAGWDDDLTMMQGLMLIQETSGAQNLLAYGTRALRQAAFLETTRDPIMTMLSIGVEKALKTALGLAHVAEHRVWPPKSTFKNRWRHNLVLMNEDLMATLDERIPYATHRAVVEPMLEKVRANAAWKPIVAALSRYGQSGRFYYLDALAEDPQSDDEPSAYWNEAEIALLESRPEFRSQLYAAANNPDEWEHRSAELTGYMADAIEDWWDLIATAGKHAMLSERGKTWGFEIDRKSVGRQIRS